MNEIMQNECAFLMPESAREAFLAANEKHGNVFIPRAFLGSQVVAGLNYAYLCAARKNGGECLFTVKIYRNLRGEAKITAVKPVVFSAQPDMPRNTDGRMLCGGWKINTEEHFPLPAGIREASEEAAEKCGLPFNALSEVSKRPDGKSAILCEVCGALYLAELQKDLRGGFSFFGFARLVPFS